MPSETKLGLGTDVTLRDAGDLAQSDTLYSGSGRASAPLVGSARAGEGGPARGDSIGRFVVLGVLGTGGMGIVYSAYDPHLDRKVAIKLLAAAAVRADAEEARTRLLREAQALAKINHPNVIKVHEVGTYADQVYVAMEFADAGTLRAWLKAATRPRDQIIDVLARAGRGLAAAHAAGLIHRDFKPDNVLMTKDGGVLVTDFGLVGVMTHDESPAGVPATERPVEAVDLSLSGSTPLSQNLTRTGSIMGTPSYMAPEQFSGANATARADQFSFCVALYEALYGSRPFPGDTFQELATNVLLGEVAPAPKGADVPGRLRRVLVKGLSVKPADRYASITELLDELERDPTRRRRTVIAAIAGAACIAAAVLVFALRPSAGSYCQAGASRVAAIWNDQRRAEIQAVFEASNAPDATASFGKLTQLLDRWGQAWEAQYLDACEDTRVRGDQSGHLLDLRMQCLTRRLDDAGATIELLAAGGTDAVTRALQAALALPSVAPCADTVALLAAVAPPEDEATRARVELVRARLDEARAQERLGRYAKGLEIAKQGLTTARAAAYRPALAEALLVTARLELELAAPEAIETVREALHVAADSGDTHTMVDAAATLTFALTTRKSRYDTALEIAGLAEATANHAMPTAEIRVRLYNSIGLTLATRGQPTEAQTRYEQALALAEKELGPDDPAVLTTLNQLGNLAKTRGRYDDARKLLERVLATRERQLGPNHPDVASALNNLGNVHRVSGKFDEARRMYDRALAIRIAALGPEHPEVGTSYNNLGTFYSDQEDHVAAQAQFEKALALWEKAFGTKHVEITGALINLGTAFQARGELASARTYFERALEILVATHGDEHPTVATVLSNLGVVLQNEGKLDEALALFKRAQRIGESIYGPEHPDVADYMSNIATVLKKQDKLDEAEVVSARAIRVIEKAYGAEHPRMGMALANLGNLQLARDRYAPALESFQRSLAIFEAKFPADHPYLSYSLVGIGVAHAELGRPKEAVPPFERSLAIREKGAMPPGLIAEVRFALAEALAKDPTTRARAIGEAKKALGEFDKAGNAERVTEVRRFIAGRR